ncbi:MAG TPA: peptide deformylase [Candidatus Limnocylindrales bacterium]|nr:peptide deformylase [Candidatus Limnocylindrales bacterium]
MAVLEVHRYPSRILTQKSQDVRQINARTAKLLNDMVDTMYVNNGIGLAAPQVGVLQRAIVVDTDSDNRGKKLLKILNPVIAASSGSVTWEEGCLSVVNYTAEVRRARHILVKGWTIDHKEIEIEASDLDAVCLQHEIDHLDGTLFIDHISRLKRELYRKRARRLLPSVEEDEQLMAAAANAFRR